MINRETKLLQAKRKLDRFQRARTSAAPGSSSVSLYEFDEVSHGQSPAGLVSNFGDDENENENENELSPSSLRRPSKNAVRPSARTSPTRRSIRSPQAKSPIQSSKPLNVDTTLAIIEELSSAKHSLESRLSQTSSLNAALLDKIALLEREKEAVESQTKRSASQSPTRVSLEKYQQLESDLEAAKSKEASLNIKISELETSLVAATTAVIPTSDNTADLLEKLAAKDEQLESVHSQLQLLQGDFQLVQAERSQYLKELEQKSELIGSLQSQVDQLTKGVEAGKDVLTRVEASDSLVKQLQEEKDSLVSRIRTLESSASEPKTSTFTEDLETKLINLEKDLLESRSENQKLQEQIDQLQWDQEWPTLNVAASPKSKTPPNSAISPSFPTTTTTPSNAELDTLKSEITHLKTEIETLSREAEQERIRSHDLQTSLTHFKSTALEVAQLQQEIMDLQQLKETEANRFVEQSTRLENEIRELQRYLKAAEEENGGLREKVDDLEEVVRSVRNSPTGANAPGGVVAGEEVVRVKKELEELRVLYENDSQRLETEVLELKKYLKASEEDNVELRERVEILEEEKEAWVQQHQQQFVFPRVETPEELKLKGEVEAARQLHKQVVLRLEQELVDLRKYLKASEEDNAELRNSLEKTEEELDLLRQRQQEQFVFPPPSAANNSQDVAHMQQEINELKKYLKASEEDNMELREKLELLEEQLEAQPNAVPPVAVPRSITPQPQPTTNTEEWDSWDSEIVPQSANTDVQISDLNRQIDVLSQDKITALEKLTVALEERKHLEQQLEQLRHDFDVCDFAKIEALEKLTMALQERDDLGEEVRAVHIERDSLLQKIATVQVDVKALQSLVEEARKERDAALLEASAGTGDATRILEDVQAKLGVAVSERDAALAERTRVREELDRLKEEVSFKATQSVDLEVLLTLQKEYDSLKNRYEIIGEEMEAAQGQFEEVARAKEELEIRVENMRCDAIDVGERLQKVEAEHEALLIEHEQLLGEQELLTAQHSDLNSQNQSLIAAAEEMHARHQDLVARYDDLSNRFEELSAQNHHIREAGSAVVGEKSSLEEENAMLQQELNTLREAGAKILEDRQALEEEADAFAAQVDDLTAQLASFTEEKAVLENQIAELRNELDNSQHVLQEAESRASRFEQLYREIEAKSTNDTAELVDTLRNLTHENSDLKHTIQEQVDTYNTLKYDNQDLSTLNSELLQKQDTYERDLAAKIAELEQKSTQLAELEEQVKNLHSTTFESMQQIDMERGQLADQLQDVTGQNVTLTEKVRELETERDQILAQVNELTHQCNVLRESTQSADPEEVEFLRQQLVEAEARYDQLFTDGEAHTIHLEDQLNLASQAIESFNTERGQLQYEIDFLKERFSAEEEFSASLQAEKQGLTTELNQLRNAYEEAQGRLQLIESDLAGGDEVLNRVTAKLSAAEEQIAFITDELEQTRAERNALSEECSMLKVQMDEYAAEKESLTAAAVELDTLRGVVGELERERTHVAEQYQHLQGAIDESQTRCVGLERQLDETNALYEQLQQQLDSTSRDSAYYQQQVSDLQAAVAALEQERDAVLGERNEFQMTLDNVNQSSGLSELEREEIRSQYESKLTDLENQIQLMHQQHEADIQIRMEQFSNTYAQYQSEKQEEFSLLEERLKQITLEAEQADKEARNASLQLEESTKYVTELQLRFDDVEAQATRSETACRDLEMAVAQLKAERDEIQEKFLDGANMLETLKNDLESSDARTNALLAEKDSAIYNLQNALDESYRVSAEKESYFEHERQSLSGRCDEAESQWKSLQAQLEGMMAQYSESQQAIDSISFQLKEAAIKLEASEQERLLISGERDSLDRQLTEFREIEAAQRVELEELHSRISQSDERIKTLEQLVDSLESQRAQFNSVINNETSLVQDIAHKQQIIENLERELFQLKSLNASPNPVFAGIPTADSLFAGSTGGRVTVEHELALLKIEVRNKEDELASVHSSYKTALAELEEKLNSLAKLNKSSVQSMELYRDELVKKSDRLDVVEEELFRLKSTIPGSIKETPDTSMLDISKYEEAIDRAGKTSKTLDELLSATSQRGTRSVPVFGPIEKAEILDVLTSQISTLIRSTETNVSISRKILNEVSVSSPRGIVPSSSVPRTDDGQIKLIVQSQSSILDDHKRLLNDVEVLARLFKESGSSKKSTGEDLSVETLSLVSKFIVKVEEYQQSVNGFALTKQAVLEDIRAMNSTSVQSKTILSSLNILISGLEDVASQNNLLKKEISYLGSLVNKVKQAPSKPDAGNDYHLSSREYGELVTKANQSERYQLQVENAQTLLAEHVREIQILKQAVDALNLKLARETGSVGVSDVQTFRIMTQQIDELKKVWSHELSANMILRNLIAKTQAENMVAEQESRKQNLSLREEFDELAVLFEESQAENDLLRNEVEKKEELVRNAEVRAEEQFNSRFFEMEQQHIEQNQQLEDMYDKERVALNKLVSNLEKERNRLLTEVTSLKDHSKDLEKSCDTLRQENSSLKSRNLDNRDLGRREQELVADVQALERQLHEERKVHERRMMDREAEWQRIREEDLRRRGNSSMEDALRVFRSEKEHLEHDLMLRNNQIHTLEVRIQELLQEAESPRRPGGSRREMEMERDLQASFSQIRDLKNQLANADHARRELESQLTLEKDRSKRLSVKADDLKRRYQYQQRLLEDQEESINSALRPAPRGGTAEDQLHDEIAQLRRELHSAKQSRSEIINIIRDTLVNTVGEASIDAAPASATSASSMIVRQSQRIDMTRLRNQMSSLIAEVIYLRALASRLFLWRADLKYQKVYLALKVADLAESQKATVKFITEMGVDAPQRDLDAPVLRPLQKFRAGVNVVIGVYRMMVMARAWQDTLEENNRDYLPIVPSTIQDIDDDGILTDISMPNTPYGGSSLALGRSASNSARELQTNPYAGAGPQRSQPQQYRYPPGDMYASDASDISNIGGRQIYGQDLDSRKARGRGYPQHIPQYQQQAPPLPHQLSQRVDPRWIVPGGSNGGIPPGMGKSASQEFASARRSVGGRRRE